MIQNEDFLNEEEMASMTEEKTVHSQHIFNNRGRVGAQAQNQTFNAPVYISGDNSQSEYLPAGGISQYLI